MPVMEDLLRPISAESPCGEDLSFSLEYDRIREARRSDDPTLAQGDWVTDLKSANWPAVINDCSDLLANRSKDMQLAVWLAEAATRLDGFAGLAFGYRLVAALVEQYWDGLYPLAEDGDQEQRIGNLGWLLAHSPAWLKEIPLTNASQGRFGLLHFETARARQANPDDQAAALDGLPALEVLETARRNTSHDFYRDLVQAVPDCLAALDALEAAVDARLGVEGPSFSNVRDQLQYLEQLVRRSARDAGLLLDDAPADEAPFLPEGEAALPSAPQAGVAAPGVITTRKEALAQLRRVAEFFRRTEPHSPVAYLADKAARWGEMPLHSWLKRVIKDEGTLAQIEELLDVSENVPSDD